MLGRQSFLSIEPQKLGAGEHRVAFVPQVLVLLFANLINGLIHQLHDMKTIKDDLFAPIEQATRYRVDVTASHVHGHRFNALQLFICKLIEVGLQACAIVALGDFLHRASVQIADNGDVVLASPGMLLIDSKLGNDALGLGSQPSLHGPVHQMPGLVPADAKNPSTRLNMSVAQHLNGKPFKKQGEARTLLRPGKPYLAHSVFRANHPRRPGMQKRAKLTTVQMPPCALRGMIVQRALGSTLRAPPLKPLGVLNPDIDSLIFDIDFNLRHRPWSFKSQQMMVQFCIMHDSPPYWKRVYHNLLPTENPEAPLEKGEPATSPFLKGPSEFSVGGGMKF